MPSLAVPLILSWALRDPPIVLGVVSAVHDVEGVCLGYLQPPRLRDWSGVRDLSDSMFVWLTIDLLVLDARLRSAPLWSNILAYAARLVKWHWTLTVDDHGHLQLHQLLLVLNDHCHATNSGFDHEHEVLFCILFGCCSTGASRRI